MSLEMFANRFCIILLEPNHMVVKNKSKQLRLIVFKEIMCCSFLILQPKHLIIIPIVCLSMFY